jgi:hypothetical protein
LPVTFDQLAVAQRPFAARLARQQFDDDLALRAARRSPAARRICRRVRRQDRPRAGRLPRQPASSRKSIEKPVAGRSRPKALPTPS